MSVLESISETFIIPATHPSLPGHFPGNPVVPGVVLLEAVEKVLVSHHPEYDIVKVSQAKFTHLVRPEQAVDLQIQWAGGADAETLKARFKLTLSDASGEMIPAANGQLVLCKRAVNDTLVEEEEVK